MSVVRNIPANRCLNGHSCPETSDQQREAKIKALLVTAGQRKRANRALSALAQERRCRFSGLLQIAENWAASGRLSPYVFEVLIERIEGQRRRNELSFDEIADLERAKASPVRQLK